MVDSTGLKVYGEGEWQARQQGWTKRRTGRKLHVGVNEATGEGVAQTLTSHRIDFVLRLRRNTYITLSDGRQHSLAAFTDYHATKHHPLLSTHDAL